jgi:RNA polymerase sigma-70 factor (sigma-E family)
LGVSVRPGTGVSVARAAERDDADDRTFSAFFEAHYQPALRLAALLTGNNGYAEDVVCDAFAKVYARWRRGGVDDVEAYLRRAVVNTLRSRWRRNALETRKDASVRTAAGTPHASAGFEHNVVERDAVWAALDRLPVGQRRVVVLRYYEDLSESEVAQLLDIAPGTVKSQGARGLVALQQMLGGDTRA